MNAVKFLKFATDFSLMVKFLLRIDDTKVRTFGKLRIRFLFGNSNDYEEL